MSREITGKMPARKIRKIRKAAGLTQEEFARFLWVTYSTLNRWEAGRGFRSVCLSGFSVYWSESCRVICFKRIFKIRGQAILHFCSTGCCIRPSGVANRNACEKHLAFSLRRLAARSSDDSNVNADLRLHSTSFVENDEGLPAIGIYIHLVKGIHLVEHSCDLSLGVR